jgi:hypothetical protein
MGEPISLKNTDDIVRLFILAYLIRETCEKQDGSDHVATMAEIQAKAVEILGENGAMLPGKLPSLISDAVSFLEERAYIARQQSVANRLVAGWYCTDKGAWVMREVWNGMQS